MSDVRVTAAEPNRLVAYVVGGAYLALGVVGGAVTLGESLAPGGESGGLGAGWVVAYVLVGLVLVVAAARGWARRANTTVGTGYLLACVPLLAAGVCSDPVSLDRPDGLLHLVSAALLLGFGRTQD